MSLGTKSYFFLRCALLYFYTTYGKAKKKRAVKYELPLLIKGQFGEVIKVGPDKPKEKAVKKKQMMKYIRIYTLVSMLVFCSFAKGQNKPEWFRDSAITSEGLRIENGLPKGGPHTDPTGKRLGFALLWTRVINETSTPLKLTINFPADSFAIPPRPDSYLKLFLAPDTTWFYEYGAKGLKSFLDTAHNKPTTLQTTIHPKEEYLFYIGMLSSGAGGMVRAGLVLKEQKLFYRVSIIPHFDSVLFPCGYINFKK